MKKTHFEWDELKNQDNIQKHGIDFCDVSGVFDGPMMIKPDQREDYGEARDIGIGLLNNRVVVVVFTERGDLIRLISARKANKYEREQFERQIADGLGSPGRHGRRGH